MESNSNLNKDIASFQVKFAELEKERRREIDSLKRDVENLNIEKGKCVQLSEFVTDVEFRREIGNLRKEFSCSEKCVSFRENGKSKKGMGKKSKENKEIKEKEKENKEISKEDKGDKEKRSKDDKEKEVKEEKVLLCPEGAPHNKERWGGGQHNKDTNRRQEWCWCCKKRGHSMDSCWFKEDRQKDRHNTPKKFCKVHGNCAHTTNQCYTVERLLGRGSGAGRRLPGGNPVFFRGTRYE